MTGGRGDLQRWLTDQLAELHAGLDEVLDVDRGLLDARLPGLRADLDGTLDEALDTDAGLGAILAGQPRAAGPERSGVADVGRPTGLGRLAHRLARGGPDQRMVARSCLPLAEIYAARSVAAAYGFIVLILGELEFTGDIERAGRLARRFADEIGTVHGPRFVGVHEAAQAVVLAVEGLSATSELAVTQRMTWEARRGLIRHAARQIGLRLAEILNDALGHTRKLARREQPGTKTSDDSEDLHRRIVDLEVTVVAAEATIALSNDVARAQRLDRELDYRLEVVRGVLGSHNQDAGSARGLIQDLVLALCQGFMEAGDLLHAAVTDFAGADLTDAELGGFSLVGVRWSATTRWPPGWRERIERSSVRIHDDLWEIRDGPSVRSVSHNRK